MNDTSRQIANLKAAIDRGSIECIKSQLRTGSDPNAVIDQDDTQMTILAYAIRKRAGLYIYRALLDGGAGVSPANDGKVLTPLYSAAIEGDLRTCQELLARGAAIDQETHIGATALQVASLNGHFEVGQYLVENGANVHHANSRGMTALDMATTSNFPRDGLRLVRLFISHGASSSRFPSSPEHEQVTAFHRAVALGAVDFVSYFMAECGEDPNQVTPDGHTMLDLANADTMKEVLNHAIRMARVEQSIGDQIDVASQAMTSSSRGGRTPGPL
jgi:ankyrin repeat protein